MARKAGLDRNDVIDAAAAIADAEGLDALTLSRLAETLGIRAPSLYAHVEGLPGLRRALALRGARLLATALDDATSGHTGEDAVRALAAALRTFEKEHPGLYDAAAAAAPDEDGEYREALLAPVTLAARALRALGISEADEIHVVRAFRAALHGFVDLERNGGFGLPVDVDESFDRLVETLIAGAMISGTGATRANPSPRLRRAPRPARQR